MGLRVFQRLDVLGDLRRDHARVAGNTAADCPHYAEFTQLPCCCCAGRTLAQTAERQGVPWRWHESLPADAGLGFSAECLAYGAPAHSTASVATKT